MTNLAWNDAHTARRFDDRRGNIHGRLLPRCEQVSNEAAALLFAAVKQIAHWRERARQRKTLGELDDRMLRDIGVTRYDAITEAEKPFWR